MSIHILIGIFFKNRSLVALILIFLLSRNNDSNAQLQNTSRNLNCAGKDFWIARQLVNNPDKHDVFYITGAQDANITFEYTALNTTRQYTLHAGNTLKIILTNVEADAFSGQIAETVSNNSLHISSDKDIVVNFVSVSGASDDGTILYPSDNQELTAEYYLNGPQRTPFRSNDFTIVSRCDSVELEITPTIDTKQHPAGIPFTVMLNKGDAYSLGTGSDYVLTSTNFYNHVNLAGTKITIKAATCCNPINVFLTYTFGGAKWPIPSTVGEWFSSFCCNDQLLEQLLPINTWDTIYPVVQLRNNPYNIITLVSSADNNIISFDGIPQFTLNKGQKYDTIIKGAVLITAEKPISITQEMLSQSLCSISTHPQGYWNQMPIPEDSLSDPSLLWLTPLKNGIKDIYFTTPTCRLLPLSGFPPDLTAPPIKFALNVVTLISKSDNINSIRLNNTNVAAQFLPFPGTPDYMYAYLKLDSGLYHIQSRDPIIAYYYGAYMVGSVLYSFGDATPVTTFLSDTAICANLPVLLSAGHADQYLWSNGSSDSTLMALDTGLYSARLYFHDSCNQNTFIRYFHIDTYKQQTQLTQKDTIYKCLHDSLILSASDSATSYLWSDGRSSQQVQITAYGDAYSVLESYQEQCNQRTHSFTILPPELHLDLGPDVYICHNERITLTGGAGENTLWSTGHIGDSLTIDSSGLYWAQITDSCNTALRDSIIIIDSLCADPFCTIVFPTAFSPNGDGHNDEFRPMSYADFAGYQLMIFNRWGEKIYQVDRMGKGWNGMYREEPSDIGVYFYICTYECPGGGNKSIRGEITLVR